MFKIKVIEVAVMLLASAAMAQDGAQDLGEAASDPTASRHPI